MWQCKPRTTVCLLFVCVCVYYGKDFLLSKSNSAASAHRVSDERNTLFFSFNPQDQLSSLLVFFPAAKSPSACTQRCLLFQVKDTDGNVAGAKWSLDSQQLMTNPPVDAALITGWWATNTDTQTQLLKSQSESLDVIQSRLSILRV